MKDTLLYKRCPHCGANLTLMECARLSDTSNRDVFLIERCTSCKIQPTSEVARLHEDQSGLKY